MAYFKKSLSTFSKLFLLVIFSSLFQSSNSLAKTKSSSSSAIVILAAGQGSRMKSDLAKVLHKVGGLPIIFHLLNQVHQASPTSPIAIVVGSKKEQVISYIESEPTLKAMNIAFIVQDQQKGTGHATLTAIQSPWGQARVKEESTIFVMPGDSPLVPAKLIAEMTLPLPDEAPLRLLTCYLDQPKGYGRVIRNHSNSQVLRIVEEKDANSEQKKIHEVSPSTYLFNSKFLNESLKLLTTENKQNEYYLTDLIEIAQSQGKKIETLTWPEKDDIKNVNTPEELIEADAIMKKRQNKAL